VTTDNTLMNVSASPVPTSTRAAIASGSDVDSARRSWPAAIVSAPVTTSTRPPNRSSSRPTGICRPA
jgi:hypothetical protein